MLKHLKDFRSCIATLPRSETCRATTEKSSITGILREKKDRNLLTTYELFGTGVQPGKKHVPMLYCKQSAEPRSSASRTGKKQHAEVCWKKATEAGKGEVKFARER